MPAMALPDIAPDSYRDALAHGAVTIRPATPCDDLAVARVAALDSAHAPLGDLLVAEVDGEIRAALPLDGGPPVADPFYPSAPLVTMLRARAGLDCPPLAA